ncbi:MAG: putative esterase [Sediminicola sp.]|jgi:predicted esterase
MIKYSLFFTLLLSLIIFSSCKDDKMDEVAQDVTEEEIPQDTTYYGAVIWQEGFPKVRIGTYTTDIEFSIDQAATIYYLVAEASISFESADQLIAIAKEATTSDTLSLVSRGMIDEPLATEIRSISINDLTAGVDYFLYAIAENPNDSILQEAIFTQELALVERQQVFTYASTAEDREVLYLAYQTDEGLKYPEEKYPAIIFMGGNGERAAQGEINIVRNGSLAQFIDKGNDVPMFVFSPQHIKNTWNTSLIHEMVEEALKNYPIDENKIYMTGISGGGIGTWNYAVDHPDVLAAMIPISGDGRDGRACDIKDIPTWAFHNSSDGIVSPNGSINMVNAMNACSPAPTTEPLLTLFDDSGHNAWRRVYDANHPDWGKTATDPVDIYSWFLQF